MLINILRVLIQKYGKEYEEEFDISKLNKKIKFDKGNYRLVFESNADYSNKRYIMVEFEI